jgi:PilZ domain-containing protein
MSVGTSPDRQTRVRLRHDLRTLTYVTLDQANGGIIRNLTREGIAVQMVAAVRPRQQVRLRFELRYPRLRVETRGEVVWATFSGQCGIRFLDLPPRLARQIDEWIFGNLLEGISLHVEHPIFEHSPIGLRSGLMISEAPVKVIPLPVRSEPLASKGLAEVPAGREAELDWLSQPLSGQSLVWTVNALAVAASLLLFALVFLAVTRELPRWPAAMAAGAGMGVTAFYWGFFKLFGGSSPGARLARLAGYDVQEDKETEVKVARFR